MKETRFITKTAVIAGLYVILTVLNAGFSSGPIQCRLSEALCILPIFTFAAVPGVTIGCLIANIIVGGAVWDIVFGTLATLLGALGTYFLRKRRLLPFIPPIAANTVIVPFILSYVYKFPGSILWFAFTVCAGEVISCGIFGALLFWAIRKNRALTKILSE